MPTDPFAKLPAKDRSPHSARILARWVTDAQKIVGVRGERVGWVLASTLVTAALQRVLRDEVPVFLIKGEVGLDIELEDAIATLTAWIKRIATA